MTTAALPVPPEFEGYDDRTLELTQALQRTVSDKRARRIPDDRIALEAVGDAMETASRLGFAIGSREREATIELALSIVHRLLAEPRPTLRVVG